MNDDDELDVLCVACDSEGRVPQATAAVLGGVAQTVIWGRGCRWCKGTGRRAGLHPPV
ncbi:hypothetical protein ACWGRK_18525 [Saccharomonospora azurea]|uniref:hypothetical protein n=1 Tax=Saccharomonospora azurea TaxID=40988 RepID=UPI002409AA7B|nr:hypothetical protein [Saccharomonospora azurea]